MFNTPHKKREAGVDTVCNDKAFAKPLISLIGKDLQAFRTVQARPVCYIPVLNVKRDTNCFHSISKIIQFKNLKYSNVSVLFYHHIVLRKTMRYVEVSNGKERYIH